MSHRVRDSTPICYCDKATVDRECWHWAIMSYLLSRISLAKHFGQGFSRSWSFSGICFQKWKKRHRTDIIWELAWSIEPPLTRTSGASAVAKNGVSLVNSISLLQTFLGAGRWTISPSKSCKKSDQAIIEGFHRKSFNMMISACSAPTHAKVPVAGLQKAW